MDCTFLSPFWQNVFFRCTSCAFVRKAAGPWTHQPCHCSPAEGSVFEALFLQEGLIKSVHQGLIGRFAAAPPGGHWGPKDSILLAPSAAGPRHFTLTYSTFGVLPGFRRAWLPFVGGANLVSHPTSWCWCTSAKGGKKTRKQIQIVICADAPSLMSEFWNFDTHSEVHLAVSGCWHCCQRTTGSCGWSPEGSAFLGPDESQQLQTSSYSFIHYLPLVFITSFPSGSRARQTAPFHPLNLSHTSIW